MGRLTSIKSRIAVLDTRTTRASATPTPPTTPGADRPAWAKTTDARKMTGRPWRRLRAQILVRDLYLCQCDDCAKRKAPLIADEVDHTIPVAEGGTDDPSNLRAMHHDCHARKTLAEAARAQEHRTA